MSDLQVKHHADQQRYVASLGGQTIGHLAYQDLGDSVMLTHTEISPQHGGKGYGGHLVKQALDDLRQRGQIIVPECSFVVGYIEQHPEYLELLHPNQRGGLSMEEQAHT